MNPGDAVRMEYIRPGKETTYYEEDFISQDAVCLHTHKTLSQGIVERLSRALQGQNLIAADQQVLTIKKTYFFTEAFNILEFRGSNEKLLGYYSDIGEPTIQLGPAEFQMTDLFLDIWLHPDGRVMELDWDEFEEAIRNPIITSAQANLARDTMRRLLAEVTNGLYPIKYL